jgi:hypothetical protein
VKFIRNVTTDHTLSNFFTPYFSFFQFFETGSKKKKKSLG